MMRTPLHKYHLEQGAKMVDFAGWEMPIMYKWTESVAGEAGRGGIHDEHHQVRNSGGFFDVSHMGRIYFKGKDATHLVERLVSRRVADMDAVGDTPGQCRYAFVCNEEGGVRDDVLVYRMGEDHYLIVVNASNRVKLMEHFEAVRSSEDLKCDIDDQTEKTAMVAIQGPKVMEMISEKFSKEIPTLKRFRFLKKNYLVVKLLVSRTGYTGEDGIEAILPAKLIDMAMKMLMSSTGDSDSAIVKPAGLGCRDTLRLEAGMPLYGNELLETVPATASGFGFAINLDKHEGGVDFIGGPALRALEAKGGPERVLTGLTLGGKRTARAGMRVLKDGAEIGTVTSACMSPTLGVPIAMAMIDRDQISEGASLDIERAGADPLACTLTGLPFYKAPKAKPAPASA